MPPTKSGRRLQHVTTPDLPLIHSLLTDIRFAGIWLALRLYIGWQWFQAGWQKAGDSAWMGDGSALRGFWERAVIVPDQGSAAIQYGWYREFLTYMLQQEWYVWFAKLVVIGQVAVGIALILGAFVGIAACFGAFMNLNFMLAGTAGTNPMLFSGAILLIIAWKTAGWIGFDRWLLPLIGTPWSYGSLLQDVVRRPERTATTSEALS